MPSPVLGTARSYPKELSWGGKKKTFSPPLNDLIKSMVIKQLTSAKVLINVCMNIASQWDFTG